MNDSEGQGRGARAGTEAAARRAAPGPGEYLVKRTLAGAQRRPLTGPKQSHRTRRQLSEACHTASWTATRTRRAAPALRPKAGPERSAGSRRATGQGGTPCRFSGEPFGGGMLDRAGAVVPLVGTFRRIWPTCPLEKVSGRRRATDGESKPRGEGRAPPFPLSAYGMNELDDFCEQSSLKGVFSVQHIGEGVFIGCDFCEPQSAEQSLPAWTSTRNDVPPNPQGAGHEETFGNRDHCALAVRPDCVFHAMADTIPC